jgi:hypothetical protein
VLDETIELQADEEREQQKSDLDGIPRKTDILSLSVDGCHDKPFAFFCDMARIIKQASLALSGIFYT